MITLTLNLIDFRYPYHCYFIIILHPLIYLIHMSHGQTSYITLALQLLNSGFRTFIFLLHLIDLDDQSLDDTFIILNLALMEYLLCRMRRFQLRLQYYETDDR